MIIIFFISTKNWTQLQNIKCPCDKDTKGSIIPKSDGQKSLAELSQLRSLASLPASASQCHFDTEIEPLTIDRDAPAASE